MQPGIAPTHSALSGATQNNPYAEFGITVIFMREHADTNRVKRIKPNSGE
jgi:hypothetical protein